MEFKKYVETEYVKTMKDITAAKQNELKLTAFIRMMEEMMVESKVDKWAVLEAISSAGGLSETYYIGSNLSYVLEVKVTKIDGDAKWLAERYSKKK